MEINKNEFKEMIDDIFENNCVNKIIVSNPYKSNSKYNKIVLENKINHYMENSYTQKQSFTKNIDCDKIVDEIYTFIDDFKQYNLFANEVEFMIKVSKSGKLFLTKNKIKNKININSSNNRIKNYILKENEVIPPLVDMGVFSAEGKIINSMYDKYKQINKFIELIDDYIKDKKLSKINFIDFGCGKSYLTFVVYYYFHFIKKIDVNMIGFHGGQHRPSDLPACPHTIRYSLYPNTGSP